MTLRLPPKAESRAVPRTRGRGFPASTALMEPAFAADTTRMGLTFRSREDAARVILGSVVVVLGAVWVAWLGFRTQVMGDYRNWFAPSTNALIRRYRTARRDGG